MEQIWFLIGREAQDKLIVLMFELLLKEKPRVKPVWVPPDQRPRELVNWQVIGNIESQEEIGKLMTKPTMKRVTAE
jgi:hypothetical protein